MARDIERLERLFNETGDGQDESQLTIDLAGLVEAVQRVAKEQVANLVDMAKADALDLLGETRQALSWWTDTSYDRTLLFHSVLAQLLGHAGALGSPGTRSAARRISSFRSTMLPLCYATCYAPRLHGRALLDVTETGKSPIRECRQAAASNPANRSYGNVQ